MATTRIQTLPKFPVGVEAGRGILVSRSGVVFTFAVDPDVVPDFSTALPFSARDMFFADGASSVDKIAAPTGDPVQFLCYPGSGGAYQWSQVALGAGVSGTLGVINGGTGASSLTGLLQGNGSGAVTALAGSDKQVLRISGSSIGFGTIDISNVAVVGAFRLQLGNVVQGAALSVLGVTGNATADYAAITAGSDHQVVRRSGTAITFGAVNLAQPAAVTGTLAVGNGGTGGASASAARSSLAVAGLADANAFSNVQTITVSGQSGVILLSGGAANFSSLGLGRAGPGVDALIGVAGATDNFLTGVAQGDFALRAGTGALWLGVGTNTPGIRISGSGTLRFSQHTTGNLTVDGSGNLTASRGQLLGTATNDSATAGNVGEIIASNVAVGAAVSSGASGSIVNITSITLTAGHWYVWATAVTNMGGTTQPTSLTASIHTANNAHAAPPGGGAYASLGSTAGTGQQFALPVGGMHIQTTGTTLYLNASAAYTVSTMAYYGYLGARRIR